MILKFCLLVLSLCDMTAFKKQSVNESSQYFFLKEYNLSGQELCRESYVLTSGTSYLIQLYGDTTPTITLKAKNGEEVVACNAVEGQVYKTIQYQCKATGIYYFDFKSGVNNCAASFLYFKRS